MPAEAVEPSVLQSEEPRTDWEQLVSKIQSGDSAAFEALYNYLNHRLQHFIASSLYCPETVQDCAQTVMLELLNAIRQNRIKTPHAVIDYAYAIARHRIIGCIHAAMKGRNSCADLSECQNVADTRFTPEAYAIREEQIAIMRRALRLLPEMQRDLLTRCFVLGQSQKQIMEEMEITDTQYRLTKWRAKARLIDAVRCKLAAA